jgi:hypothetical protein
MLSIASSRNSRSVQRFAPAPPPAPPDGLSALDTFGLLCDTDDAPVGHLAHASRWPREVLAFCQLGFESLRLLLEEKAACFEFSAASMNRIEEASTLRPFRLWNVGSYIEIEDPILQVFDLPHTELGGLQGDA